MRKRLYITFNLLLVCVLNTFAQSGLQFSSTEWNFGTLAEESGLVRHRFALRNTGEVPELILDVTATCGCMKPTFSRKPILPGEESVVEVAFQPAGQRGMINRTLTVFGDRNQVIARLRVVGEVIPRKRTIEELFPVEVGRGIRLSGSHLPFGTVSHGEIAPVELRIINTDSRPHQIRFIPDRKSGYLEFKAPSYLASGEEKRLVVGYLLPTDSRTYGTLTDTYYIEVDGERQITRLAMSAVAIDPPAPALRAPHMESSADVLRMGEVHHGARITCDFTLSNTGQGPLCLRAVELPEGFQTTLKAGDRIPAGESHTYSLEFDATHADYGTLVKRLLLVTNDPNRPLWQPRVVVTVID